MKKMIPQIALIALVAVAWIAGINTANASSQSVSDAMRLIEENEDLETYKNALELYDQMISEYPEDISWYERKADAYYKMESYNNYLSACDAIIAAFPDAASGYQRKINYYHDTQRIESVFEEYAAVPEALRSDESISSAYRDVEYATKNISSSYSEVYPYQGSYAVIDSDGFFGYLDEEASPYIDADYTAADVFWEDAAAVQKDSEWFLIDKDGDRVHATHDALERLYSPNEGLAAAKVAGKCGYYNAELRDPQHFEYEDATSFCDGVAAVKKNGKWALIGTDFHEITGFDFDDVVIDFSHACTRKGLLFAKVNGSYQLYDAQGNRRGSETFDDARLFSGELAAVSQKGKWGFVDPDGTLVVPCQFDGADSFHLGVAPIEQNEKWGFVDTEGEVVVEPQFSKATVLSNVGVAGVGSGDSMRYIQFYKYANEEE